MPFQAMENATGTTYYMLADLSGSQLTDGQIGTRVEQVSDLRPPEDNGACARLVCPSIDIPSQT